MPQKFCCVESGSDELLPLQSAVAKSARQVATQPLKKKLHQMNNLLKYRDDIIANGPSRVLISPDEGVASKPARVEHGITPDVIFIRHDGWSLGAPSHLEADARKMWEGYWIGILRKPNTEPETIIPSKVTL